VKVSPVVIVPSKSKRARSMALLSVRLTCGFSRGALRNASRRRLQAEVRRLTHHQTLASNPRWTSTSQFYLEI
jgi:hypothetical protein